MDAPELLARDLAGTLKDLVPETFSGIYGNANKDTRWLSTAAYADLVSGSSFHSRDLVGGRLTVFVQVPLKTLQTTPALGRVIVGALLNAAYPEQYRDPAGLWTPTRLSYYSIGYNTKLVAANKVPKTYADLLDPQWKGKMAWRIGSSTGTPLFLTNLRLAWGDENAARYFEKLKGQMIANFGAGSARTMVDRVIAGEYAIALNVFAHHPLISKAKGAPVDSQLMDPVASTAATMAVVKGVRHPHAAMLLVDFILSKEGQEILLGAQYFPADPDVAPSPLLASVVPKIAGVRENFIGPEKLLRYNDSSEEIFQRLFR